MEGLQKINPIYLIGGTLIVGGFVWQQVTTPPGESIGDKARALREATTRNMVVLQASEEWRVKAEQIANTRYEMGCLTIVSGKNTRLYSSLSTESPVLDYANKTPIAEKTVVCDYNGNTAEIGKDGFPVKETFAFTGNREVIDKRIKINEQSSQWRATQSPVNTGGARR